MTRAIFNNSMLILTLLLMLALIVLVFVRGLARRVPSFTALLIFYVLRFAFLFFLAHRMIPASYAAAYNILAIVDLFLQLIVAIELAFRVFPIPDAATPGDTLRRAALLLFIPVLALGATILLGASIPSNSPVPADRLQLFDSLFFVLLGVLALARTAFNFLQRIVLGLAVFGVVSVASTLGRTLAALHHDAPHFIAWSYSAPIVWLFVILFWLITLKPDPPSALVPNP